MGSNMENIITCNECLGEGSIDVMNCSNYSNECCGGCTKKVMCECCRGMGELYPDRDDEYGNRLYELSFKINQRINDLGSSEIRNVHYLNNKINYFIIHDKIVDKLNQHIANIRL